MSPSKAPARTAVTAAELARAVAEELARAGADTMFGVPGGGNNLELVGAAEAAGMRFVLAHGETAAAIMASTYAELTRRTTACVVTRGPGVASVVNGAAQAMLDRQPMLLVTDAVSAADRERVSHQQIDQRALLGAVTKWSGVVGPDDPGAMVRGAIELARRPRPGPVHLDFDPAGDAATPLPPLPDWRYGDRRAAAALVAGSRRPLVLVGVGARDVTDAVRELVRNTNVPVLMTYKAAGAVPDSWPNAAGLLTGAIVESELLDAADLIVAVGVDAVELIPNPWPYAAPVLSIAAWPEDHPYLVPALELVGEMAARLGELRPCLRDEWPAETGRAARRQVAARLGEGAAARPGSVSPHDVVASARRASPAGSPATVDAGAHMLVAMPLWDADAPGELLISSGLATMGFALPAAVASALAFPERRTVCLTGDGGLEMQLAELETAVRLRLPITVVVFNDSTLSLIAVKQRPAGHGGRNAVGYQETDFAAIAAGFGMESIRVGSPDAVGEAVGRSLTAGGPVLVDVQVDPSSYPHVLDVIRGAR